MNKQKTEKNILDQVYRAAGHYLDQTSIRLISYLKYELLVANTELAISSKDHGYDFKSIPESIVDNIVISQPNVNGRKIGLTVTIPQYQMKNMSESQILFFKQYILKNAISKIKSGY